MPIRDVVLTLIVFGSLPFCLMRPYIGVLVWTWISFMNPHRLTWSFAYDMPFALIIAIPTLLGLLVTKDRRNLPLTRETFLLGTFWLIVVLSTIFSMYPDEALPDLNRFSKILLMIFVTIMLVQDREKLRVLLIIAALSIGFYGLKGGLWTLKTGGAAGWVLGPERSFIGDNNGLALALNMTLPILFYVAREESHRWFRRILYTVFCFSILGVLLTYSRAGFVGLVVVGLMLTARSKWKIFAASLAVIAVLAAGVFLTERWYDRMSSISEYEKDNSAMSRIYAWTVAWNIALQRPLLGGGSRVVEHKELWERYAPAYYFLTRKAHSVHSIYFQALAEHGFTGLFVVLALIASTLLTLRRIRRDARRFAEHSWLINYSLMTEAAIFAFLATGAFQNLLYFDLFYFLIAVTVVLRQLTRDAVAAANAVAVTDSVTVRPQPVAAYGYSITR
jgi:putative inorganic carbon (hco3(-)) transporter